MFYPFHLPLTIFRVYSIYVIMTFVFLRYDITIHLFGNMHYNSMFV
jgi:hypothetical protein